MISAVEAYKLANSGLSDSIDDIDNNIRAAAALGGRDIQVPIKGPLADSDFRLNVIKHLRNHGYAIEIARHPNPSTFTVSWR